MKISRFGRENHSKFLRGAPPRIPLGLPPQTPAGGCFCKCEVGSESVALAWSQPAAFLYCATAGSVTRDPTGPRTALTSAISMRMRMLLRRATCQCTIPAPARPGDCVPAPSLSQSLLAPHALPFTSSVHPSHSACRHMIEQRGTYRAAAAQTSRMERSTGDHGALKLSVSPPALADEAAAAPGIEDGRSTSMSSQFPPLF